MLALTILLLIIYCGIQAYKEWDTNHYIEKYGSEAMWRRQWKKLTKHNKRRH